MTNQLKTIYAASLAAIITVITLVVVTIWAELSESFKEFLKSLTGHHWLTKSYLIVVIFFLAFWLFSALVKNPNPAKVRFSLVLLELAIILGVLSLLGFYAYEYFLAA